MNISFVTSGHEPFDDRIFYHMARSLCDQHNNIQIISSKSHLVDVVDDIRLDCFNGDVLSKRSKIAGFVSVLSEFRPAIIICSEPLTLLAAKRYSKLSSSKTSIICDITEWYPSKKNLAAFKAPLRWVVFIKLLAFNLYVSGYAHSFIFGEWYKSRPYRLFYHKKPFIFTTYYPDLRYISEQPPTLEKEILRLSYSGKISAEKGIKNFFMVLKRLTDDDSNLKINVKVIGWFDRAQDKVLFDNLTADMSPSVSLTFMERQPFKIFIELIKDTDIFLDLRSDDFENQHCLPIKLFYYAALGRPVVHTNLKAIRKEVEIDKFGFLVDPNNPIPIVQIIRGYLDNKKLYYDHCRNARIMAENIYNWKKISPQFLRFVESHSS